MNFMNAMDNYTPKTLGEKGHVQHSWSNELREKIVQFSFQLVRTKDTKSLETSLREMLNKIKHNERSYLKELTMLYKLIGHTRDLKNGKGEYNLAFMQMVIWNEYYPELAHEAFKHFVVPYKEGVHQYGSWKDVKYMCNYIKENTAMEEEDQEFIDFIIRLSIKQLNKDYEIMTKNKTQKNEQSTEPITLIGKWLPREKSKKFGWIHSRMAKMMYPHFITSRKRNSSKPSNKGIIKAKIFLNKKLTELNKYLNTVQVNMCGKKWRDINFNNVTSITMRKNKLAFNNKDKQGNKKSHESDRLECADNFENHVKASFSDDTVKVHGKRCNVYELVKDAIEVNPKSLEADVVNQQWKDNSKNNNGLGNIIPMSDTSSSMHIDDYLPFYNSIGLGIRVSEKTHPVFRNRILTFESKPKWVQLNDKQTFCEKVKHVKNISWGGSTDFFGAMKLILQVLKTNKVPPSEVEDMVLAVFSDMQIDESMGHVAKSGFESSMNTMMDNIKAHYSACGYNPPHILFWNLRKTDGFPNLSTTENTTMLSGYNATMLNVFCEKGMEELKKITPARMLEEQLNDERYQVMGEYLISFFEF